MNIPEKLCKNGLTPVAADEQTEFKMTWDDTALYVAVRCANTNAANLKPASDAWGMDHIEFFIVPGSGYTSGYYQAAVSAAGKVWGPQHFLGDYMWGKDPVAFPAYEVAAHCGDKEWTCEFVVPFKALKEGAPKAGDSWRVNVVRGASSWSRLPIGKLGPFQVRTKFLQYHGVHLGLHSGHRVP